MEIAYWLLEKILYSPTDKRWLMVVRLKYDAAQETSPCDCLGH